MSVTEAQIRDVLRKLPDPEIGRNLIDLDMVKAVRFNPDMTEIQIELPTPAYPRKERIGEAVEAAIKRELPQTVNPVATYCWDVKGKNTGGAIGLKVKNVVAVGSGKGGVGKSTIAASLAYGLHLAGAKVGVMDADIYGPSIPHLFGVNRRPEMIEEQGPNGEVIQRIEPIEINGIKLISIGFLIGADEPVVVRGPILHRTITQFLQQTSWGPLDYLIIDLPPGTGDVSLTLSQLLGLAGAVVVCTPQQLALLDAVKALNMYQKVKIPVLGMVENMTGEIFGRGGAKKKAEQMGVPFLGEVPINAQIRVNGDGGLIADNFAEGAASREPLIHMCERVAIEIAKTLLETPTMPTLEIL